MSLSPSNALTINNNQSSELAKLPEVSSKQTANAEIPSPRPQSPNVEQIAERNQFFETVQEKNTGKT